MTRPSNDYAPLAAGLLVLSLVAILVIGGDRAWTEDCANPEALRRWSFGSTSSVLDDAVEPGGALIQWTRGPLEPYREGAQELRIAVIRSFDPISLYARPARLRRNFEPDRARTEYLQSGEDVLPVHFLYSATTRSVRMLAYLLASGPHPVEHPFWSQIRSVLPETLHGKRPMTAFLVGTLARTGDLEATEEAARVWLIRAWQDYRSLCSP